MRLNIFNSIHITKVKRTDVSELLSMYDVIRIHCYS